MRPRVPRIESSAAVSRVGLRPRIADLRFALVVLYAVALLAIPTEVGLHLGVLVLSPSRIVLGLAAITVVADGSLRRVLSAGPRFVLVGWFVFLLSAGVTTALNHSSQSFVRYGSLVFEGLVLFIVVWCVALDRRGLRSLQLAVVATTSVVAALTVLLALAGIGYSDVFRGLLGLAAEPTGTRFGLVRQEGSFPAPLFFAAWLAGASMLILPWLEGGPARQQILAWAGWLALILGAILTVSRTGLVVALAGGGIYFLLRQRRRLGVSMLVAAFVVALILTRVSLPVLGGAAQGGAGPGSGSVTEVELTGSMNMRIEALQAAWPALQQKPLFGWGLLSAGPVLTGLIGHTNYVDSSYVGYLVDLGALGMAAFLMLVFAVVRVAARRPWSSLAISRLLALITLLGMMVFVSFLGITQGIASFVIVLAMASWRSGTDQALDGASPA